ncbi:VWA domain-containing protein [Desulfomonile tiedjei]|uniref:Mg-chelatase subunit ChlI n=1 Tax=Desulfomonile tiedjei (strain ATCC 49306 / DSM 6799 / DCB-1) TaxID=706587 RepID=I4CEQ4_DESTA|nr:VWA domain-containing protein [Desulfomonile tiedjei]AFM28045.1 Mg-chelatase subunit ChlI [Desulfomonile tiedjei DSM 6799]
MGFSDFVGHEDARLALTLNAIEPLCGGVLFAGEKGSGKTTLARLFKRLLPERTPFVTLPLNVTEDALVGTIDIETTIRTGKKVIQRGLLSRAHGGILFVDDVNLLSPESVSLVLEVSGRGANFVEREGLSERHDADFMLIATMDPQEAFLSPHFIDRFGMCVLWESLWDKKDRTSVVKRAVANRFNLDGPNTLADEALRNRIQNSRRFLKQVTVSEGVWEYIAQRCLENAVSGHRAELFLYYATKAYAAYRGDKKANTSHVDAVAPLVLVHRRRNVLPPEEETTHEHNHEDKENEQQPESNDTQSEQQQGCDEMPQTDNAESSAPDDNDEFTPDTSPRETALREEVFDTGETFRTKRLSFRKDRLKRMSAGRRTKTRSKDKGGRYVRSILRAEDDVAIDATIRAAAPYQSLRNRDNMLVIHDRDLRYKQREKKTGHLVIFAVDGSGSMGAQKRMVETKGAIQSLLMDCYQKRDKVAMLVFRKEKAEIVLPPTSSVEHASRRLKEIPTGGKTPLGSGLMEAYNLIKRYAKKAPETRFLLVIITDGRANHSLSGLPVQEEVMRISQLLSEIPGTDYIVVDTEDKSKFMKADFAVPLADRLNASYYTIDDLKADYLVDLVKQEKG